MAEEEDLSEERSPQDGGGGTSSGGGTPAQGVGAGGEDGEGDGEDGDIPKEKKNLLHDLFGEESEEEDSSGGRRRGGAQREESPSDVVKRPKKSSQKQKKSQKQKRRGRKDREEAEEEEQQEKKQRPQKKKQQREEDGEDDEGGAGEGGGAGGETSDYSQLPTFTSSLDNQEEPIAEEQELLIEEMPYERPSEGSQLCFFKLAGLGIEPKPFDEQNFTTEDEEGEENIMNRKPKKKSATTVRWRWNLDKNQQEVIKESNARFVKWSDGSMHLFVGKDAFGVKFQDFKDHHHLFIRQRKDASTTFLQCHGVLEKKITLEPIDNVVRLQKEALKKLRNVKAIDVSRERRQFVASTSDPEKEKKQKELMEANRSELKRKFEKKDQGASQEITAEYLEQGADFDDEREKAHEARIIAAKRGHNVSDEEGEYDDDEEDYEESDGEPEKKKSRR